MRVLLFLLPSGINGGQANHTKRKYFSNMVMTSASVDRLCRAGFLAVGHDRCQPLTSSQQLCDFLHQIGKNPTRHQLKTLWSTTGEQGFTLEDSKAAVAMWPDETHNLAVQAAFRRLDVNGDGRISMPELHSMICDVQGTQDISEDDVRSAFRRVDRDRDATIDFDEFMAMVNQTAAETVSWNLRRLDEYESRHRLSHKPKSSITSNDRRTSKTSTISSKSNSSRSQKSTSSHEDSQGSGRSEKARTRRASLNRLKTSPTERHEDGWIYRPQVLSMADGLTKYMNDVVKTKGCMLVDTTPTGRSSLLCHQYQLTVNNPTTVTLAVKPLTNCDMPATSLHDLVLFLADTDSGQVLGCTERIDEQDLSSAFTRISLSTGTYDIIPFVTSHRLDTMPPLKREKRTTLLEARSDGGYKLSKRFRMVLMNVFDMFDMDDSGCLSRNEFNVFNVRTGDLDVTDEEWHVLTESFETKDGQVTMRGFLDLHEMEANDAEGDTDDLWMALEQVGYDQNLQCTRAWPFQVSVSSGADVELTLKGLRPLFHDDDYETKHELIHYWQTNGISELLEHDHLKFFHTPKLSVCLAPPGVGQYPINISALDNALKSQASTQQNEIRFVQLKNEKAPWAFRVQVPDNEEM